MDLKTGWCALMAILATTMAFAQSKTPTDSKPGWLEFELCPVFVVDSLDIPAQENGMIAKLDVQVNQDIESPLWQ